MHLKKAENLLNIKLLKILISLVKKDKNLEIKIYK